MTEDTFPKLLRRNYERYGDRKAAMRKLDFGVWQEYTWKDYYEKVKYLSLGLISFGIEPGDKVIIIGDNAPQWYWTQIAVQASSSIPVGVFSDSIPSEVQYIVDHSDAKFVIAEDQEQIDKILAIKDDLPMIKKVIYWDDKGMRGYEDPLLINFEQVIEQGKIYEESHPGVFEKNVEEGKGEDIGLLLYTSGTGGLPKGVMLRYESYIKACDLIFQIAPWKEDYNYVSFVPAPWSGEQIIGIAGSLVTGLTTNFPEKPETVQENIRQIAPQILVYGTRLWESLLSTIQVKINDTSSIKRLIYTLFLPVGYKLADLHLGQKEINLFWKALYKIGEWTTFRPLKDKLGLVNVRSAFTGGAAMSPDCLRFFHGIGVPIRQLYGSTESSPIALHWPGEEKAETVGVPPPGVDIRILTKDNEIITKCDATFVGYYKSSEITKQVLDADGWFHTGDAGHLNDDGHLIYYDRVPDLMELAGGNKFAPVYIENRLKFSPYIKDAMVIGGKDKAYVSAILVIDFDIVGKWAEAHRIPYTTFADLSQRIEICDLIYKDVAGVNKNLPEVARIKKYISLHKEFDPDEKELTRTRKLRRSFVEEAYKDIIGAMYSDAQEVNAEAEVKYQDGRKGKVITAVRIKAVEGAI